MAKSGVKLCPVSEYHKSKSRKPSGHPPNENTCATLPPGSYGTNVDLLYEYTAPNGGNNGNPSIIYDPIYRPRSQYFTYDSLNRLQTAETMAQNNQAHNYDTGHCWGESYSYDPWGNLLSIGVASPDYNGCAQENLNQSVDTQNHVIGETYDAAGNLISIPEVASYTFDAENHLISAGGVNYSYDGDGRRASKSSGVNYFYDGYDSPLQEDDPNGNPIRSNFLFNGKRVLSQEGASGGWVDQFWTDAVGNVRGVYSSQSWQTGQNDDIDYYPFGGERGYVDHGDNNYKFIGKERDAESNLDNFGARYYSSQIGRFMSVDPDNAGAEPSLPQSWNMYTYALDNPLGIVDPDGMDPCVTAQGAASPAEGSEITGGDCEQNARNAANSGAAREAQAANSFPLVLPLPVASVKLAELLAKIGGFVTDTVGAAADVTVGVAVAAGVLIYSPATGTGATLSPAQMAAQSTSNPFTGPPGSTSATDTRKGGPKQVRRYGADGYPETDVDYDHGHNGAPRPHAHDWGRPADGSAPTHDDRQPWRDVLPTDPQHPKAQP